MKKRKRTTKLYLHIEEDLFSVTIIPAARRQCPQTRPPVLTTRQQRLWSLLTDVPMGCAWTLNIGPTKSDFNTIKSRLSNATHHHYDTVTLHELPGCIRVIATKIES